MPAARYALLVAGLSLGLLGACGSPPAPTVPPPSAGAPPSAAAPPPTIGGGGPCSPTVSLTRWSDSLNKTRVGDTPVEGLSALAIERDGGILALSDRSTLVTLDPGSGAPVSATPLADESGKPLDSEAIVIETDDTRLVTSETEPAVRSYDPTGRLLGRLPFPDDLRTAPAGRAARNKSLEGLTRSGDGRTLTASFEGALAGDDPGVRRLVTWQRDPSGAFRLGPQYALRADPGLDVSDLAALPDGRLLVLERSFTVGVGNTVHLVLADPRGADDVTAVPAVAAQGGPRLAPTSLLADLGTCPAAGAPARGPQRNPLLDNIEGMAITGVTPTGRLDLLAISDDNGNASQTTRLYGLRVAPPP